MEFKLLALNPVRLLVAPYLHLAVSHPHALAHAVPSSRAALYILLCGWILSQIRCYLLLPYLLADSSPSPLPLASPRPVAQAMRWS